METRSKPRVYISYTWRDATDREGRPGRVPDERGFDLAERLRKAGIDARLDVYYSRNLYGLEPPVRHRADPRDPWVLWQEEQVRDSDCVIMLCTPEYVDADPSHGQCPGKWCDWRSLAEWETGYGVPGVWWDWHFIASELESSGGIDGKFITVGFGPYHVRFIPAFVRGAAYYNLESTEDFEGLVRGIKREYRRRHPREGVFVSYAHKDEPPWLGFLLTHLTFLKRKNVQIWTDQDILPGAHWHDEIQSSLARAKVAVLMVTPAFLESPYIENHELPGLLEAAESEGLVIFWIPVKPSSFAHSELAKYQAAHPPSEPLSGLSTPKRDQAFVRIASRLADALGVGRSDP